MQFQRKHRSPLSDDSKCFRLILVQDDGDKLQDDLNKLFQWSRIWGMEFNAKKCKVNNNNNNFNSNILVRFFRNYLQTISNL